MALVVCLLLGLVSVSGITLVRAEEDGISDLLSAPVYTNALDSKQSNGAPTGWSRSSGSQNANGSTIVTDGGRTYLNLKRNGSEG